MELITMEIDMGQMMVESGGLIKKGDKICFSKEKGEFFLAPFSGKLLAVFENIDNISLIIKLEGEIKKN